nr:hypothetical protein [Clostridiales bacterium]
KIVGDAGADYREEYENSYTPAENEEGSSPYANADANAYKQKPDIRRILTFAGIAVVVLAVIALAAFMIKTALDKYHAGANEVDTRNSTLQSSDAIDWDVDIYGTTAPVTEITSTETTTEEITTAPATEIITTRRYISTTRRYVQTTARRVYTTARPVPSTTAAPVETTVENTTASQTQPATTGVITTTPAGTTQANATQSSTTQANATQPVSAASTTAAAAPTTPATTGANELPLDVNH